MWRCPQCGEAVEDQFTSCWSCGIESDGSCEEATAPPPPVCGVCQVPLAERGEMPLRVGGPDEGWRMFRDLAELDERLWRLQVYVCPTCRRVTFFEKED